MLHNQPKQMLTGHAYSRALRGHILVHQAISKLICEETEISDFERAKVERIISDRLETSDMSGYYRRMSCYYTICTRGSRMLCRKLRNEAQPQNSGSSTTNKFEYSNSSSWLSEWGIGSNISAVFEKCCPCSTRVVIFTMPNVDSCTSAICSICPNSPQMLSK